ncbi:MAG TPA: UDP-N-acetylglucosamine 1-carboxyvinyltransferase [Smithellaceae bacterium]|nr:UDP-N-acetylglucosamine 1-carboxyvinyltransferase [Smithellaceae bacterium]HRS88910.1 UDP-N-acetylglucosamine 1-carboxyvinyltransferase [Smithellaceae bacterium]HRV26249.1 UDP-N-acetylglucosamine 1-carboxyvinyltransferase [Smithellaceae bacterium]
MDKIIIQGGKALHGDVLISGAKNAALPVMAAALLTEGTNTFHNIPDLMDIKTIKKLLRNLGAQIEGEQTLQINVDKINSCVAPYELVKTMRASVLVLGPLVARMGVARVSLPGGCAIGARPVNLHIKALEEMGAQIELKEGYIEAKAKKLKGAEIYFDISTVTGTENVMMAATLAQGTTILRNAACEPEVVNLAEVLNGMGAKISGAGTDVIKIEGVTSLKPTEGTIIPDRIEAGTFMIAAGMTHGELNILGCVPEHLEALINKLRDTGMKISPIKGGLKATGTKKINSVDVKTLPYPGFATDLQAQMMAYMSIGGGLSVITETVFENRFMHVSELARMGADITIQGNNAIVRGVPQLRGAPVMATDLRASASLILAALVAKGTTEISRVYHLDRGYEQIEKKFSAVGANIKRVAG